MGCNWSSIAAVLLVLGLPARVTALNPLEDPSGYIVSHWDTESGLPHNSIKQLLQTRDGYLWVGTGYGLARFDGLAFTVFTSSNTPAFRSNQVTSLVETLDGSLWIGTADGLVRYLDGKFTSYTQEDGLRSQTINTLCLAPDGSLWIGGRFGVTRWVDGAFVNDIDLSAYDTFGLRNISVAGGDTLWISTGAEVLRYERGNLTRFGATEGIISERVEKIRERVDGGVIAITQNGLYGLEGDRFVLSDYSNRLSSQQVSTAERDRDGNFWVGSVGGLDRITGDRVSPYTSTNSKRVGVVDALLEDREGCLWLGTSTGLYRFTNRRAASLSQPDGITGTLITSIRETRDGSLWVGSWGGGIDRLQGGTVTHYGVGSPLSHETVTLIYEAPDGTMWLGNRGSSIDRLDGNGVTTYIYESGVASSRPVTAVMTDDEGILLLGIDKRGLLELREGQIVPVMPIDDWADIGETVWAFHRTSNGTLLMGTSRGLYQRGGNRIWQHVPLAGAGPGVAIRAIHEEADGSLWFATAGHGLVRWQHGRAHSFGTNQGMIDDTIFGLVDDGLGSFWVTSARGIARIRKSEFTDFDRGVTTSLNSMPFGRVDGLLSAASPGSGAPSACRLSDGRLIFATDQGVAVINPAALQTNDQPPTVVIETLLIDGQPVSLDNGAVVPPGINRIEFHYTALSLIAPERLRFRYQLEGSDPAWIEAGGQRSANYTHLSPGHYTFRVLASNNDGLWNETGVALAVRVLPRFYQTFWFAGLMLVAVGGAGLGTYRVRVRQSRRQMEVLRGLVTERTRELQTAKEAAETAVEAKNESILALRRAQEETAREQARFRFIFETVPVGITWMIQGEIGTRIVNPAHEILTGVPRDQRFNLAAYRQATHPDDRIVQDELHQRLLTGEIDRYNVEKRYVHPDGTVCWTMITVRLFRDPAAGETQEISTVVDITALKQAEAERSRLHRQLLETSRQAGMAEVATGVLHNVGNVLNSVNVSATLVTERVRESKVASLQKLSALLQAHTDDLAGYLGGDPKGRMIPGYLASLATALVEEQAAIAEELGYLRKNIEHIKDIVAMQQSYAKVSGIAESVAATDLVEDAIRMNASALSRHEIEVIRDYQAEPTFTVEQHKVLQILVNLIRNAKYACDESGRTDKQLTLRVTETDDQIRISVIDNGVGIAPENLARIFSHGFTTRKDGHGFGLHSGALAARELGGSLQATSPGPGLGAMFVLTLPRTPDTNAS